LVRICQVTSGKIRSRYVMLNQVMTGYVRIGRFISLGQVKPVEFS